MIFYTIRDFKPACVKNCIGVQVNNRLIKYLSISIDQQSSVRELDKSEI